MNLTPLNEEMETCPDSHSVSEFNQLMQICFRGKNST